MQIKCDQSHFFYKIVRESGNPCTALTSFLQPKDIVFALHPEPIYIIYPPYVLLKYIFYLQGISWKKS